MIKISFYLLNPKANFSTLYVSLIGEHGKRLRFSTGQQYETYYFNTRKKKGKKLVKRNTELTLSIQHELEEFKRILRVCEMEIKELHGFLDLEKIKTAFYEKIGIIKAANFFDIFNNYLNARRTKFSPGTIDIFENLKKNHLENFEKKFSSQIKFENINANWWIDVQSYFIEKGLRNNSINKNLRYLKRFLRFCCKEKLIKNIDLDEDFPYLDETEVFKIALKKNEVEELIKLKISNESLELHRDRFITQILTGQRVSDLSTIFKNLDLDSNGVSIMQEKGGSVVFIPLYNKLRNHLKKLVMKYPDGLPGISNQKYNDGIKEAYKLISSSTQIHEFYTKSGNKKILVRKFRHELVSSHTGRRTFVTLGRMNKISDYLLMKVTGHKSLKQFLDYCKVDDMDLAETFNNWE